MKKKHEVKLRNDNDRITLGNTNNLLKKNY
jgi:hypothetical protein